MNCIVKEIYIKSTSSFEWVKILIKTFMFEHYCFQPQGSCTLFLDYCVCTWPLAELWIVNSRHAISIFAFVGQLAFFFRTDKGDRMGIPIQMFQRPILAFTSYLYISPVLFEVDSTLSNEEFTHRFYLRT